MTVKIQQYGKIRQSKGRKEDQLASSRARTRVTQTCRVFMLG